MNLGTFLILLGILLAVLDAFVTTKVNWLLHAAVVLIGTGVLVGAEALVDKT